MGKKQNQAFFRQACIKACNGEMKVKRVSFDGQTITIGVCSVCKMERWSTEDRTKWSEYNRKHDEKFPPVYVDKRHTKKDGTLRQKEPPVTLICANQLCKREFKMQMGKYRRSQHNQSGIACSFNCKNSIQRQVKNGVHTPPRSQRVQPT